MRRQISIFISYFILLFLWIIAGWNTDNADLENYRYMYESYSSLSFLEQSDVGYAFLAFIFKSFGCSFELYHIIIYLIMLLSLLFFLKKQSKSIVLVLIFYVFTTFFRDVIQLRNFVALIFLYPALWFLVFSSSKYKKILYIVLVALSSTIHSGFLFYLVFLFYDLRIDVKLVAIISLIASLAGKTIFSHLLNFDALLGISGFEYKVTEYLSSNGVWSVPICFISISITYYLVSKLDFFNNSHKESLLGIIKMSYIILIFAGISMTMFRLFDNLLVFLVVYILNVINLKKPRLLILFLGWFVWFSYWTFWGTQVFVNLERIFNNNSFL